MSSNNENTRKPLPKPKPPPAGRPLVSSRPEVAKRQAKEEEVSRPSVAQRLEAIQRLETAAVKQSPDTANISSKKTNSQELNNYSEIEKPLKTTKTPPKVPPLTKLPNPTSENIPPKLKRLEVPQKPKRPHFAEETRQPVVTQRPEKLPIEPSEEMVRTSSFTCQKEGNTYLAVKPKTSNSVGSVRTSSGLIMIINLLLLVMSLLLAIVWRGKVTQQHRRYYEDIDDLSLYFIGSLLVPLFVYMLVYIKQLFDFDVHVPSWIAASVMSVFCLFSSILIFVSSSFLLKEIRKDDICMEQRQCMHLIGTTIMAIIVAVGVFVQGFCHFTERKVMTSF